MTPIEKNKAARTNLAKHKEKLQNILQSNGYNSDYNTFEELLNAIDDMYILNPQKANQIKT